MSRGLDTMSRVAGCRLQFLHSSTLAAIKVELQLLLACTAPRRPHAHLAFCASPLHSLQVQDGAAFTQVLNVMGLLFMSLSNLGSINIQSVLIVAAQERTVSEAWCGAMERWRVKVQHLDQKSIARQGRSPLSIPAPTLQQAARSPSRCAVPPAPPGSVPRAGSRHVQLILLCLGCRHRMWPGAPQSSLC